MCMKVDRLSITMDPALGAAARKAAKRAKLTVSAWIAEATADRLRSEALKDVELDAGAPVVVDPRDTTALIVPV